MKLTFLPQSALFIGVLCSFTAPTVQAGMPTVAKNSMVYRPGYRNPMVQMRTHPRPNFEAGPRGIMRHQSIYEETGIPNDASQEKIEKSYTNYQEDKLESDIDPAEPSFKRYNARVEEAYKILRDPAKRAAYDEQLARMRF